MIEFTPGQYIIGIWYLEHPEDWGPWKCGGNTISVVYREPDAKVWKMVLRHRYYCGEEATTETLLKSGDEFKFVHYETPLIPEAEVIDRQNRVFGTLSLVTKSPPEFFHIAGDPFRMHELAEAGRAPRWFNVVKIERASAEEDEVSLEEFTRLPLGTPWKEAR